MTVGAPIGQAIGRPIGRAIGAGSAGAWTANFLAGEFPENITFTRASNATDFNSSGTLVTEADNEPRFDYNPLSLQPRGLLLEGARTNLLLNSATLSTQSVTVTAVAHTLSFYGTGTVTLSGASTAGPLVGTGAFPNRVSLTFTPTAGTLTLTVTGTVQFANLEPSASFPSSYIPTTGTAATRAADSALNSVLASIGFNPLEGTVVAEFECLRTASGAGGSRVYELSDGTINNFIGFGQGNPGADIQGFSTASGVATNSNLAAVPTSGQIIKAAQSYKTGDNAFYVNGIDRTGALGAATIPSGISIIRLGSGVTANRELFGWLRRLTYYPTRLPNATLQALTA